jgi:hypothetical protein
MTRTSVLRWLSVLLLIPAASAAQAPTLQQLDWLAGCWAANGPTRQSAEHWMAPAGGTMLGMSRTLSQGKTAEYEFMMIRQDADGSIHFVARPSGQAGASFKLSGGGPREAVFENLDHDFPQRVIYRLAEDGTLAARIEGTVNGKQRAVDFPMQRAGCP